MKLIFAIIRDKDANKTVDHLVQAHMGVTKLHSSGGFLRDGNTTLMIGLEKERVDEALEIIQKNCAKRTHMNVAAHHSPAGAPAWKLGYPPVEIEVGGATVFVMDVDQFHKL